MARLETTDAGWLLLRPYGYQFPSLTSVWDDWVNCEWELQLAAHRVRRTTQASFLTWEFESIVAFFRGLAAPPRRLSPVRTVEPFVFALERWSDSGTADLVLTLGLPVPRPLRLAVAPSEAAAFAEELARDCLPFPRRTPV